MKVYDWGVFWEDGNKGSLPMPFGPEHPDNILFSLDGPWIDRAVELYPNFVEAMNDLPFGMIVVNAPREATSEEEEHLKEKMNEAR